MTSSAALLDQLDARYPHVLPINDLARRYRILVGPNAHELTRAETLTKLQQSIQQGNTPDFFYDATTGYHWLHIDRGPYIRPMTIRDSTEYSQQLPPTDKGRHTVAMWLAQHQDAPRYADRDSLSFRDGPTNTSYPLKQVEQLIDREYTRPTPSVHYDRLTLYVGGAELQITPDLSTPHQAANPENVSNPVESTLNLRNTATASSIPRWDHQEEVPENPGHIGHAKSLVSSEISEEVLAGDDMEGWAGKKPALTLAWDAVDEGKVDQGVVTGPSLSALLSAFDPPLPTDVKKPLLLGLGGYKESGKDALADHLGSEHGFYKLGMSYPLIEVGRRQNPWILLDRGVACGAHFYPQGTWVKLNVLTEWLGYDESKTIKEVREYYQTLGTQVGRHFFGEDTWVELAREKINSVRDAGQQVVVTGIRFANELDVLKRLGGHSVWISRPGKESDGHESESSLSKEDFDLVVDNDRDLETLYRRGSSLLQQVG